MNDFKMYVLKVHRSGRPIKAILEDAITKEVAVYYKVTPQQISQINWDEN